MRGLHLAGLPHNVMGFSRKVENFERMGWGERLTVYNDPSGEPTSAWPDAAEWRRFNDRVLEQIRDTAEPHDLLLLTAGTDQEYLARESGLATVEYGIGYRGVLEDSFHAFESHAWRHHTYGRMGWDCRPFDTVIPGFFDTSEFPEGTGGGGYLLFAGRDTHDKGPEVAREISDRAGMRLVVAAELGVLEQDELHALMAGAAAVLVPTLYVEPFGNVAVEAMLCGTPVVASDWGAFTETVEEGVTGYRFSTIREGVEAVEKALTLPRDVVRQRAVALYSLPVAKAKYAAWFDRLESLWNGGYYAPNRVLETV